MSEVALKGLTGLELMNAAQNVQQQLDDSIQGRESIREQHEAHDDGEFIVEAVRLIQGTVVDEDGEEGEEVEDVELRDGEQFGRVTEFPMAKFVAEHGDDLFRVTFLDQGIEDDNVLLPWEPIEVRVTVCAPLAAVNDVQFTQRELELFGQVFDAGLQRSRL